MRELVHEDIPFIKEELTKEEAVARFAEMGCPEKITILAENPTMKRCLSIRCQVIRIFSIARWCRPQDT